MKRKLAGFGLAFALAELTAAYLPPPVPLLAAAFVVLLTVLGWVAAKARVQPLLPLAIGVAFGLVWSSGYQAVSLARIAPWQGRTVSCVATVETDCTPSYQGGMLRGTLHITEIDGKKVNFKVYSSSFPGTQPGQRFAATLTLGEVPQDDYRLSRYARGISMVAEYQGGFTALTDSDALRFHLYRLRKTLSTRLGLYMSRSTAALEAAMLLGDKSKLSEEMQNTFRTAGVSHLLAVSGLHVTLLCGLLQLGGARRRKFSRPFLVAQAMLVLGYMALTGFPISVVRAGMVFLLSLLGCFLLQPPDLLTSLGAAAVLLGLQNAYAPGDLGFQLSFCGVLGVHIAGNIFRPIRAAMQQPQRQGIVYAAKKLFLDLLQALLCATLAALATMPVLIAHDLTTSGVGVLCNLLVVWMLRPALILGLVVIAASLLPLLAPVMHLASLVLAVWLNAMYAITSWCASLPMAKLVLPRRYTLLVLAVLGLMALCFWYARRIRYFLPLGAVYTVVAVCLGVLLSHDVVRIALVGTAGNPCAVVTQNGQAVVLFRGGAANQNAVAEYLSQQGDAPQTLLVDMRQKPEALEFNAQTLLVAEECEAYSRYAVLDGLAIDVYHNSSGNLAVLEVGDSHIAMMTGNIALAQPVYVDVLCAAGAVSDSIQANTILFTTANPRWLEKTAGETLLYGSDVPVITLRAGRSIIYEEVEGYAVQ